MAGKRTGKARKAAAEQVKRLRARVQELEETFLAIQRGRVDAVVINSEGGDQVFTLQGAEHPYRVLVETMNEGAATLDKDGTILYANASFAGILHSFSGFSCSLTMRVCWAWAERYHRS